MNNRFGLFLTFILVVLIIVEGFYYFDFNSTINNWVNTLSFNHFITPDNKIALPGTISVISSPNQLVVLGTLVSINQKGNGVLLKIRLGSNSKSPIINSYTALSSGDQFAIVKLKSKVFSPYDWVKNGKTQYYQLQQLQSLLSAYINKDVALGFPKTTSANPDCNHLFFSHFIALTNNAIMPPLSNTCYPIALEAFIYDSR